jgi:hypothetical protein
MDSLHVQRGDVVMINLLKWIACMCRELTPLVSVI